MNSAIRMMIVDDHPAVRTGLAAVLEETPGLAVIALAADGSEAVRLFHLHRPDVTLMDLQMPVMDGVTATEKLLRASPEANIIILTCFDGDEDVYRSIRAGARAYLLKDNTIEDLVEAIHAVHAGGRRISPEIAEKLADRACHSELTERELDVLREITKGKTNEEIAARLNIAPGTVKTHINHLLSKLRVSDRTQAVIVALRRGLVHL
jgi:two-component system, NarL family, response regulator